MDADGTGSQLPLYNKPWIKQQFWIQSHEWIYRISVFQDLNLVATSLVFQSSQLRLEKEVRVAVHKSRENSDCSSDSLDADRGFYEGLLRIEAINSWLIFLCLFMDLTVVGFILFDQPIPPSRPSRKSPFRRSYWSFACHAKDSDLWIGGLIAGSPLVFGDERPFFLRGSYPHLASRSLLWASEQGFCDWLNVERFSVGDEKVNVSGTDLRRPRILPLIIWNWPHLPHPDICNVFIYSPAARLENRAGIVSGCREYFGCDEAAWCRHFHAEERRTRCWNYCHIADGWRWQRPGGCLAEISWKWNYHGSAWCWWKVWNLVCFSGVTCQKSCLTFLFDSFGLRGSS